MCIFNVFIFNMNGAGFTKRHLPIASKIFAEFSDRASTIEREIPLQSIPRSDYRIDYAAH